MSFNFGGVDTDTLAGVTATLDQWPSLGGHSVETEPRLGISGRYLYGSSQTHSTFIFDVIIQGSSPEIVADRRDSFVGMIAPSRGAHDLILELDSVWCWRSVMVSQEINWERMTWEKGIGFTLRADVAFETTGDALAVEVEPQSVNFATSTVYTLDVGNTTAYPQIEFPSGAAATVNIGGFSVDIAATPAGLINVLDYHNLLFYQKPAGGGRGASIVRYMSHYQRPVLTPGNSVTVSAVGAPAGTRVFYPNARRI